MEIRVLKYFLTAAREESITKAANLLHVTQPTLSRQLIQLEDELGVRLFYRGRRRITLTEDGMLLKRRAEEIISLTEKTQQDFLHRGEELIGNISIGSGELQSSQFLCELIASFREKYPLVHFQIHSGNSDDIKERIEGGLLDLGLLLEPVDISRYDFVRVPVKEEWGVMIKEDSPLAQKGSVSPRDLVHQPLIMTRREMVKNELLNWFGPYADQVQTVACGNLLYNMALMARNQDGICLCLKLDYKISGLQYVPFSPRLESGTVLAWKKSQVYSPVVGAFIRYIKDRVLNSGLQDGE